MSKPTVATIFSLPLLGLIFGIYSQACFALPCAWLGIGAIAAVVLFVFVVSFCFDRFISYAIMGLFFFLGAVLYGLQIMYFDLLLDRYAHKPLRVVAYIEAIEQHQEKNYKQTILLRIEGVKYEAQQSYESASFSVLCYAKKPLPYEVADKLELSPITLKSAQTMSLSGNPAFADYLKKENILATFFLSKKIAIKLLERPTWSIKRWLWQKTERLWNNVKKKLSPLACRYYSLLFLGNKSYGDLTELREQFNFWGLSHYLARSGLHIVLFVMIWKFLLSFFPLHLSIKKIFLIILCVVYHLLSWPSISFLRAYYVFLALQMGMLLRQQSHFFHLLTLTCLLILLFNPMQLFFLDFQLSFALTFALAWLAQLT